MSSLDRGADALVRGGSTALRSLQKTSPGAVALRLLGIGLLGGAVVFAGIGAIVSGLVAAAIIGAGGVAAGMVALRAARSVSESARMGATRRAIMDLARKEGGVLSVARVAQALSLSPTEADRALTSMADGSHITVEITDEGGIEYVFVDLGGVASASPLRVRAPSSEPSARGAEEAEVESDARAQVQRREH